MKKKNKLYPDVTQSTSTRYLKKQGQTNGLTDVQDSFLTSKKVDL